MKETDLYLPLKRFLEAQGYDVKAEIQDCDVLAVRGAEAPVVVELKLALSLGLVLQAVDRLALTPNVYIGIPSQRISRRHRRQVVKMLRMLGIGLVVIDAADGGGTVQVVLDPGQYRPRPSTYRQQRLLGEFAKRVGDPNLGGTERRKGIVTAYRQRTMAIARFLQDHGPTRAARVAQALGDPTARDLLYRDVYGWFDRVSWGAYALSPRGLRESRSWKETEDPAPAQALDPIVSRASRRRRTTGHSSDRIE